jgi:hypothetical protein
MRAHNFAQLDLGSLSVERDLTIDEFCAKHRMSRGTFYNEQKSGKGVRVRYDGARGKITPDADREWQAAREADSTKHKVDPKLSEIRRKIGAKGTASRIARGNPTT